MIILALRTDKPESEIYLYEDNNNIAQLVWEAHRQLAETIHIKIRELLKDQNKTWSDIDGIIIYKGPGSFTGLRIGMSVANALASSLQVPIIATTGEGWQAEAIKAILARKNEKIVSPDYGSEPHITQQKK